ncbi:uncharacterized protein [Lepisosteus oculatus]|uniref:uncharacterized protein n=1 Tax=Lepisosteus oculatus TaxID=7918 RepID=UPI0035F52831
MFYCLLLSPFIPGSFNAGINLLQFTEQNLDDLNSKDPKTHELLKAELRLLPLSTKMDPLLCLRKPAARTCSLGDVVSRSQTFEMLRKGRESRPEEEGSPRQRRVTVASYIPQAKDQDGIYSGQLCSPGKKAKALGELNTEETCWWFTKLGLQKYIPFIRGANLRGSHIASIDLEILDLLHVSTPEERECLLSAVYRELHPPDTTTQELDTLLETIGSYNVEKFTAALVNLSKAKSLQFSDNAKAIPCQFQFSQRGEKGLNSNIQKDSHLLEFTIKALEQKVHLRFPKETMVGKVIGTCLKMLGVAENKDLFSLNTLTGKSKEGVLNEFPPDRQVGDLIDPEMTHLELLLCKKDNTLMKSCGSEEISSKVENREQADPSHSVCNQNQQMDLENKEDKRRDLSQQVDRLQKVIYQVQGLHQSLASFCAELRDTDAEADVEGMCLGDTVVGLQQTERKRTEKELLVGGLRQRLSSLRAHTSGPIEVHLFDKMKLDCQIFMEEINIIFLNQQMARLKSAHQICKVKARDNMTSCTLGQLLSHQPPAVLLAIQETATAGTYGFRVQLKEGSGLVVVDVGNSKLCVNDRLVEVNGVSVVDYREEELKPLLSCQSCLIVVLRRPVPFIS